MPSSRERICSIKASRPLHRAIFGAARSGSDFARSTAPVDTEFLNALFDCTDTLHERANQLLAALARDRRAAPMSV
jgi:hypothetical protein